MVKPRWLPKNNSVWPSGCEWFSRVGTARRAVAPSSSSPPQDWFKGVVLSEEYSSLESE
jgi:hypothetical protein